MISTILVLLLLAASPARADGWWCDGIMTSNGSCIGSWRNTQPPTVDCERDGHDPRCWRRDR
jgi:hypothetical protein